MNYDNKHTDKNLQDLEHQSLPDLSKMDEHWQHMGALLQPGTTPLARGKNIFVRKFLFTFFGIVALVTICFFVFRNNNHAESDGAKEVSVNKSIATIDSPIQLRARTSGGRDTILIATAVKENTTQKNSKLLLEKFYEQLQKKPQAFLINHQRDTVINGKEGTRLYIPAYSFDTQESFTLLLTEFYSVNDMIAEKLTTTCNGRQLVTGGMIYLDAQNNNDDPVNLKNGASLRLDIPKKDGQPRMELFYGEEYYRNGVATVIDSINWNRTNQVFANVKANPVKSYLVSFNKIDSIRVDGEREERTFDYVTKDTTPGNRDNDITIKGDSIVLQKFGVNINRLGWINCDRFYNDARPKTELIVDLGDNPNNYNTMLVFDNFASIMSPSSKQGNTIRFLNLPEGEAARIVSVGIRNDKTVTAMRKLIISKAPVGDLNFEEVSPSAFKNKLK
jgi:hypothetical protein